jgi:sialic acid synthase SpsE/sugar phosphate isomerase/epimerase
MPHIHIGTQLVGDGCPAYIIAEVGINHNGNPEMARRLVDIAAEAGVNAVKFQKRQLTSLYSEQALECLDAEDKELQFLIPYLQQAELPDDVLSDLAAHARGRGIEFLCTPWDSESVAALEPLNCPAYKVSSADLTNLPLLEVLTTTGKPLVLSTGMSRLAEIARTVDFLRERGTWFALLHCHSAYPAAFKDLNLHFMARLREFGVPVGYSGHERGIAVSTAAVALGACILERHITLDRSLPGPDHAASLEPQGIGKLVRDIRNVETALGKPERGFSRGEVMNRHALAKSLAASREIKAGETLTAEMITLIGPGSGLSGQRAGELVGKRADRDIAAHELFREADITGISAEELAAEIPFRWGQVVRFHDVDALAHPKAQVLEFHLTERDLAGAPYAGPVRPQELVLHAPEHFGGRLFDLCAADPRQRLASLDLLRATFVRAEAMRGMFTGTPERAKIVVHPGGIIFDEPSAQHAGDPQAALANLAQSLTDLGPTPGIEVLLENLPPFAWSFGGQWFSTVFLAPDEIAGFCAEHGTGLCLDISHAALWCNLAGRDVAEYVRLVRPHVRHIHVADASGTDGEGLQIGEGDVDFPRVLAELDGLDAASRDNVAALMPEVWLGHHRGGEAAWTALARLTEAHKAGRI